MLSALLDRKPYLLRPLLAQVLPPLAKIDPAERLSIRLSTLRTPEDVQRALAKVLGAASVGDISMRDAARIARRVRARLQP